MMPPMGDPPMGMGMGRGMGMGPPGMGQPGMPGTVINNKLANDANTVLKCKCSGNVKPGSVSESNRHGEGGPMCNSPWHDQFWCFVTEDSQCGDGGRSEA